MKLEKPQKCEKCDPENIRKHTKYRVKEGNGQRSVQRYICKKCGRTFSNHKTAYTKTEKRLLSFLVNFLANDLENLDIKELLSKSKEYKSGISNITIEECKKIKTIDLRQNQTMLNASCKKPRLIICEDEGKITLVKVPKDVADKHKGYFQLYLR